MSTLETPDSIGWSPASVELPEMPMIQPGEDAMSATIAAVLPMMAADMTANVMSLQAKEGTFSGKVGTAQSAYQTADQGGNQMIGQMGQMLGQIGQMGGQLAQSGGQASGGLGQLSQFGSMIQQAMQGKGGGEGTGQPDPERPDQQQPGAPMSPEQRQVQQDARETQQNDRQSQQDTRQQQQDTRQNQQDRREVQQDERDTQSRGAAAPSAAGPGESSHHAGPVPVNPTPVAPRHGGDAARDM